MNKIENSGLRKHRPKKLYRFEYIRGKYSWLTSEQRYWRWYDEREREKDGYKWLLEDLEKVLRK
jgi:hypothetical protein